MSFLPFTTKLLTTHMVDAGQRVAVVMFGVNLTLAGLMSALLVSYVARAHELSSGFDPADLALAGAVNAGRAWR